MRNRSLPIYFNTIIFTLILTLSLFVFNIIKNVENSKPPNEPNNRLTVFFGYSDTNSCRYLTGAPPGYTAMLA